MEFWNIGILEYWRVGDLGGMVIKNNMDLNFLAQNPHP